MELLMQDLVASGAAGGKKNRYFFFFKVPNVEKKLVILSGIKHSPAQKGSAAAAIWQLHLHKYILTDYLWVVYIISYSTQAWKRM